MFDNFKLQPASKFEMIKARLLGKRIKFDEGECVIIAYQYKEALYITNVKYKEQHGEKA